MKISACPKCSSHQYIKNGKVQGKQRYHYKACNYNFTVSKLGKGVDNYYVRLSLRLYLEGMSFRGIERVVGVSHVSVINWVKKYGKDLKTLHTGEENPIKAVEVDEFHSYVKTKKTVYGSGLLWIEKVKGCWVLPLETEVK